MKISEYDAWVKEKMPLEVIHKVMTPNENLAMCGSMTRKDNKSTNWNLVTCPDCIKFQSSKTWKRLQTNKLKGKNTY